MVIVDKNTVLVASYSELCISQFTGNQISMANNYVLFLSNVLAMDLLYVLFTLEPKQNGNKDGEIKR